MKWSEGRELTGVVLFPFSFHSIRYGGHVFEIFSSLPIQLQRTRRNGRVEPFTLLPSQPRSSDSLHTYHSASSRRITPSHSLSSHSAIAISSSPPSLSVSPSPVSLPSFSPRLVFISFGVDVARTSFFLSFLFCLYVLNFFVTLYFFMILRSFSFRDASTRERERKRERDADNRDRKREERERKNAMEGE
ncbi:hypothetical protein BDY24DRAFT_28764 [Mrakia frigida]|uniref:uncharacterized protein n=1 Tax=Mrakia frigida TaxID=29902 RepID=UPI003FCC1202